MNSELYSTFGKHFYTLWTATNVLGLQTLFGDVAQRILRNFDGTVTLKMD